MNTDRYLSIHYDEVIDDFLTEYSDRFVSFKELAGTARPWEVNASIFQKMQTRMVRIEKQFHQKNHNGILTCILSEKGAYWLSDDSLNHFLNRFQDVVSDAPHSIPLPMWKLSAAEMVCCQVKNLRLLIVALVRDLNLIEKIQPRLNGDYAEYKRDFVRLEKKMYLMLNGFSDLLPSFPKVLNKGVDSYDRIMITMEMFEKQEIKDGEIGYTEIDLCAAQSVIEDKLKKINPAFQYQLKSVKSVMKQEIHECESIHLYRTSQWEFIIQSMSDKYDDLKCVLQIHSLERKVLHQIVTEREKELGDSPYGQNALSTSARAIDAGLHEEETTLPEEITSSPQQDICESIENKDDSKQESETLNIEENHKRRKKHTTTRMAFTSRRNKGR